MEITSDFTDKFNDIVKGFKNDAVLVGIPLDESKRESGDIGNAALLAINNFGSAINNIPARPVMQNGIKNAQESIAEEFKKAAQNVFTQGKAALQIYYERAGIIASNSIKKAITDQDFAGGDADNERPADSTLAARESRGFKGKKSLIVTGQMKAAITYIVRNVWGS